ncbi:hypothetical protein LJB42_003451 [Komagataella kurtzmanii]|nr:hypothetical protein LJB42_003451 [Komagataella kurtzmanii]
MVSKERISKKRTASFKGEASKKIKTQKEESPRESSAEESDLSSQAESETSCEDELDISSDEETQDQNADLSSDADSSEDELDDSSAAAAVENSSRSSDNDLENEDGESVSADPNKLSTKEQHLQQKKLLNERKLQRKAGIEVHQIKKLWEKLRVKNPPLPKAERTALCDQVWDLSKNVIKDLVLKHDASRVVQTLVKYSDRPRRDNIVKQLKGSYFKLATSAYGKYLLIKLLHYGSKESRALILKELHGKLRKLMGHREGAYVVEDLFVLYATAKQRQEMIREFWGAEYAVFQELGAGKTVVEVAAENTEKRKQIAQNLMETITAAVEKGSAGFQLLHAVMKEYIQIFEGEEVREMIALLTEPFAELVHTPEGYEVACTLIAKANAKERKQIIKTLKGHATELINNEYGNIVLIVLFMTVDDTVLVSKVFSSEYQDSVYELVVAKFSRRPFIYLLNGLDSHYFSPIVKTELLKYEELSAETSKKSQELRREQILSGFAPIFFDAVIKHPFEILEESLGSQFVGELLLNPIESDKREAALNTVIESFKGPVSDDHLIRKPFSGRFLRSLIQGGRWNNKEKCIDKVDNVGLGETFALNFVDEVFTDDRILQQWVNSEGSFAVVALYEALKPLTKEEETAKTFVKSLKACKFDEEVKGAKLLKSLLK